MERYGGSHCAAPKSKTRRRSKCGAEVLAPGELRFAGDPSQEHGAASSHRGRAGQDCPGSFESVGRGRAGRSREDYGEGVGHSAGIRHLQVQRSSLSDAALLGVERPGALHQRRSHRAPGSNGTVLPWREACGEKGESRNHPSDAALAASGQQEYTARFTIPAAGALGRANHSGC